MQIYSFGLGEEVTETSAEVLGGKGAGLMWMTQQGINVPPGFILPCTLMAEYNKAPKTFMKQVKKEIKPYLAKLEEKFGYMPLVSVRSGARQSMPGMMDTILNVGLDNFTVKVWCDRIGKACTDNSELRLVTMYANVVCGIDKRQFDRIEHSGDAYAKFKDLTARDFPPAEEQLLDSIEAVFQSWNNDRAKIYRKMNNIPEDWGTAVTVQAMVFGNFNDKSGTGVLFSRNPDTGEDVVTGEFAINAQGEDVVDGSTTPMPLKKMLAWNGAVSKELLETAERLEKLKGDVQDVEFTIQDGKLYILQTRNAKRSSTAAVKIATDMYNEGMIDLPTVFSRVSLADYDKAQQVVIDPKYKVAPIANGLAACTGVASGVIVTSSKAATDCNQPCILVTQETTPDDIAGMYAAKGIVTMKGGSTCHAAVVARGMNKPCIVGVGNIPPGFNEGALITIDGATGRVWIGKVPVIDGSKSEVAANYLAMLRKAMSYVPIVSGPLPTPQPAALYHCSPSAILFEDDKANITALLKQVDKLYIDLRKGRIDPAEAAYFSLFDSDGSKYPQMMVNYLHKTLSKADKEKVVLLGSGLKTDGIKFLPAVDTLEDLILADGQMMLGSLNMKTETVARVLGWRKMDTLSMTVYGQFGGEGTTSFVSDIQALQTR
jgi:pyruvate,orthophosphate dikinase